MGVPSDMVSFIRIRSKKEEERGGKWVMTVWIWKDFKKGWNAFSL